MVDVRVAGALHVPVLDTPDDVRLVGRPELDLHAVAGPGVWVAQEKVQATRTLSSLDVLDLQVAEAKERGIVDDPLLQPLLVQLRVRLQRQRQGPFVPRGHG